MTAAARLAGFAAALALAFGGAMAAGHAIAPEPRADGGAAHGGDADAPHGGEAAHGGPAEGAHPVRGLAVAEDGLRLIVEDTELPLGRTAALRFRIAGDDGATIRDFDVEHERRMHLIVVRRDLTGFQHLHPRQAADGTWSVRARIPAAGSYRVFADFSRGDEPHTLASDLHVDGAADLRDLPRSTLTADAGGAYTVRREPGELRFTVLEDGAPVRVEPYLGAGGHLVALREGDLAFLHVHPTDGEGDAIGFEASFPTTGRYRLFLQFKHEGRVRTAAFTEEVR